MIFFWGDGVPGDGVQRAVVGVGAGAPQPGVAEVGDPWGELVAADREQAEHHVGIRPGVRRDDLRAGVMLVAATRRITGQHGRDTAPATSSPPAWQQRARLLDAGNPGPDTPATQNEIINAAAYPDALALATTLAGTDTRAP
jgi:hypothetical protein